jgi:ABC-type molybdate transport system substrate-binding protein
MMRALIRWASSVVLAVAMLVTAACIPGNNGGGWGVGGQQGDTSTEALHARGGIVVAIFPDIVPAMQALVPLWQRTEPTVPIAFSIAPTINAAVNQNTYIAQDLLISDSAQVQTDALAQGLIRGKGAIFAASTLDFATPASNPGGITTLQDIARPGHNLVNISWTAGLSQYTLAALERMMRLPEFGPPAIPCASSYADCVYANIVLTVSDGIAAGRALVDNSLVSVSVPRHQLPFDGAFIYHTDTLAVVRAMGAGTLRAIPVPTAFAPPNGIWAAVSAYQAANPAGASLFQQFLLSPAAQSVLAAQGYLPPSAAQPFSQSTGA